MHRKDCVCRLPLVHRQYSLTVDNTEKNTGGAISMLPNLHFVIRFK